MFQHEFDSVNHHLNSWLQVLSVNTDHIQDPNDWTVLFNLLECAGAGAKPPPMVNSEHPDIHSDSGKSWGVFSSLL